jgi:hypothetical protein
VRIHASNFLPGNALAQTMLHLVEVLNTLPASIWEPSTELLPPSRSFWTILLEWKLWLDFGLKFE